MKNKELKLAKARVKTIRKNSGVTLIALVVTIIVMLILAGATMATLTGNNGMISNARKSANKSEEAKKEEKRKNPYRIRYNKNSACKWLILIMILCAFTGLLTPLGDTPYTFLNAREKCS